MRYVTAVSQYAHPRTAHRAPHGATDEVMDEVMDEVVGRGMKPLFMRPRRSNLIYSPLYTLYWHRGCPSYLLLLPPMSYLTTT